MTTGMPRTLILDALSGQIGGRRGSMESKAKFIFPVLATAIVVFVAGCVVTFTNIGIRADFVRRWLSAFLVGWPIASVTGLLAFAYVRRTTAGIVALIERP
jgi:Protein of unknown function (DUF2798)